MATPMTYDQLVAALRAEGCKLELWPGSRDACRCHNGSHDAGGAQVRQWGGVNGVGVHITAGTSSNLVSYIKNVLINDPALKLKSQFATRPDGTVVVLSAGRCNHFGGIGAGALQASVDETWPLSGWADKRGSGVDGNAHFYGIENIAASHMTDAQYQASVLICAAICRHYGWSAQSVCGHGEASNQRGYGDPNLDMGKFRQDVAVQLSKNPGGGKVTTSASPAVVVAPAPQPTTTKKDVVIDMTEDQLFTAWDKYIKQLYRGERGADVLAMAAALPWQAKFGKYTAMGVIKELVKR